MRLWIVGKVTGAAVGWMVGGPVGAMVGGALGHALDHFTRPEDPDEALKDLAARRLPPVTVEEVNAQARVSFATHLVALFAVVARVDGTIRREEVRIIREFFEHQLKLAEPDLDIVRKLLKESLAHPVDVPAACRYYKGESQPAERLLFVQALYEMVSFEGDPQPSEQRLINEIVTHLDISEADHHAIRAMFFTAPGLDEDYAALTLTPGASDGDLKKAFRSLAAKHHPDKVTHLGPDAVALAQKRFAEIKAAYDRIRAARGL